MRNRKATENLDTFFRALDHLFNYKSLPESFTAFHLVDRWGKPIAHYAAGMGVLPDWFDDWSIADETGLTVAHVAATTGGLPVDFDDWYLQGPKGVTVIQKFVDYGMQNWPNLSVLYPMKIRLDSPLTVAEYILEESYSTFEEFDEQLKREAIAWKVSQEIKKNLGDPEDWNQKPFVR